MSDTNDTRISLSEMRVPCEPGEYFKQSAINALCDIAEAAQAVVSEGVEVGDGCVESKGADMRRLEAALAKVRP